MLIKKCVCGNGVNFDYLTKNKIPLLKCKNCNILHQGVHMSEDEYNSFYSTEYHGDYQTKIGCKPYEIRYNHDTKIAKLRLDKYKEYKPKGSILDIGSGNGAFVDTARALGYDAWGLEPSTSLSKNSDYIFNTALKPLCLPSDRLKYFDMITLHDVLEHLVDPFMGLKTLKEYLHPQGVLIIDFPDYFEEAGMHHWREIQHLWYFTHEQLVEILENQGFKILEIDKPIASKFVFYTKSLN